MLKNGVSKKVRGLIDVSIILKKGYL